MQCYNHPDIGAVAQCQACSKGLCRECIDLFNMSICSTCAKVEVEKKKSNAQFR